MMTIALTESDRIEAIKAFTRQALVHDALLALLEDMGEPAEGEPEKKISEEQAFEYIRARSGLDLPDCYLRRSLQLFQCTNWAVEPSQEGDNTYKQ